MLQKIYIYIPNPKAVFIFKNKKYCILHLKFTQLVNHNDKLFKMKNRKSSFQVHYVMQNTFKCSDLSYRDTFTLQSYHCEIKSAPQCFPVEHPA